LHQKVLFKQVIPMVEALPDDLADQSQHQDTQPTNEQNRTAHYCA
jgi:hypothetical protein